MGQINMVVSLLIYYAQICLCKSCKNSNKDTNIDIEDMFDDDIYNNHGEYWEDGFDTNEEENIFRRWGWTMRRKLWLKLKAIKNVTEKLKLLI